MVLPDLTKLVSKHGFHLEIRPTSRPTEVSGRTQILAVVGLKFLFSCWVLAKAWSQLLETTLRSPPQGSFLRQLTAGPATKISCWITQSQLIRGCGYTNKGTLPPDVPKSTCYSIQNPAHAKGRDYMVHI